MRENTDRVYVSHVDERENAGLVYVSHVDERENAGLVYSVLYCSPMDERKTGVRVY